MRPLRLALCFILLVTFTATQAQKNLEITPEKPRPGQPINFRYNTSATPLFGVEDFNGYAYLMYNKQAPVVREIQLKKEGSAFVGSVPTDDSTTAVFFLFSKDDKTDNNNDQGYYTIMHGADGKPVPGAYIALANGMYQQSYIMQIPRNAEAAARYYKEEFNADPERRKTFRSDYINQLNMAKDDASKNELRKVLGEIVADPSAPESELSLAKFYFERMLKDKEKSAEVDRVLKQRYPNGEWARNEKVNQYFTASDPAKKDSMFREFVKQFPPATAQQESTLSNMAADLVGIHGSKGNYDKMYEFAALVKDPGMLGNAYNSIAWDLAGEGIEGKPRDVKKGIELSGKAVELLRSAMDNVSAKPTWMTAAQWKERQRFGYLNSLDTYAVLLYHNKEFDKAYAIEKEAVEGNKRNNVEMNQAYTALVEKIKGQTEAQKELESFLRAGKYSGIMKEQLKRIYLSQKKTEAQWTGYLAELEKEAIEKKRAELVKKMINIPAPAFRLKDLEGNEVSLASLKGKTVVVDFWATWCGPCIASFPGMQQAVNKYKNNPNVAFVFIDTWEGGANREKQVKDFISKNKYSFTVLYDETKKDNPDEFVVVGEYKVEGIPTKFVIDGNSNIRFKSVGYSGSADALVAELDLMIAMVSGDGKSGGVNEKKGFK